MRRTAPLLCLIALFAAPVPARADLASEVNSVAAENILRKATLGVSVVRLGNGPADLTDLFGRNAATPLIPASNLKLATTSAALDGLGADFKFRTLLIRRDEDVILIGDGDPALGDLELLRDAPSRAGGQAAKITGVYEAWAQQLKKLNITTVRDVVVDDSVFEEEGFHPRWPDRQWDTRYEAQVGGVNLNVNCVEVLLQPGAPGSRVGFTLDPPTGYLTIQNTMTAGPGGRSAAVVSRTLGSNNVALRGQTPGRSPIRAWATVHDPSLYAATVLAETLSAAGVKVTGSVRRDRTTRQQRLRDGDAGKDRWSFVAFHETPIATVLARANKDSVNVYAESLCKRLGHEMTKTTGAIGAPGSWENGPAAIGAFLKRIGVPEGEFRLDDGSGLSRQNAISPRGLTRVLAHDFYAKSRHTFLASLSVAGSDGTLRDRFDRTDLAGRVIGKSGYINGVSTLSGYLKARDGQWFAFAVMANNIPGGSNGEVKPLQERIVRAVDAAAGEGR